MSLLNTSVHTRNGVLPQKASVMDNNVLQLPLLVQKMHKSYSLQQMTR